MDWDKVDLSKNEVRINIAEFFWDLICQWKAMLLTGLLFAVIIAGFGMASSKIGGSPASDGSSDEAIGVMSKADKRTYDEITSGLLSLDRVALNTAIEARKTLQGYLDYQENSPLMNVDALNEKKAVSVIDIKNMDGLLYEELTAINTKLAYYFPGDEFIDTMNKALGWNYEIEYARELIAASGGVVEFDSAKTTPENGAERCTCTIIIPADKDGQGLQSAFDEALKSFMDREFPAYEERCSLVPVSNYETTVYDTNTASLQAANQSSIASWRSNCDAYKGALKQDALRAYGLYCNEDISEAMAALTGEIIDEEETAASSSLSPALMIALGFLAGIVIYAVVFFFRCLFLPRAGRMIVMTEMLPGMYAGSIRDLSFDERSLFKSPFIERRRNGSIASPEEQGKAIRNVIDFNIRHSGDGTGIFSFVYWSDIKEAHLGLLEYIKKDTDSSKVIDTNNNESVYEAADEANNAVLVMEDGRTPLKDVRELLRLLKAADCKVLGYVYLT